MAQQIKCQLMKELWNEISYDLSACRSAQVLEKDYENAIVQCLAILGWKKYLGEIMTQYPVQVGRETKLADIVVSSGGIERFVVEVKRPGHHICPEDEMQMFSYMRLVRHQVSFGLYIGDDIRLYYDDSSSTSYPEPILVVDITKDNPDGFKLVELFLKDNFSEEKLQSFCLQRKSELEREEHIRREIHRLVSDQEGAYLKQLYADNCVAQGLGDDFAARVLENITISIKNKTAVSLAELLPFNGDTNRKERVDRGIRRGKYGLRTKKGFSINGSLPMGCGRLALSIVRQFVVDNPHLTYDEVRRKLPVCAKISTFAEMRNEDQIRYFSAPEELLKSSDGVEYVLTNQWTAAGGRYPNDIQPMVEFAQSQGYSIEEL